MINALALSRVWYVASLIHMPGWVHSELSKLIFKFFWKGKPDLVAHVVVTQPTPAGGFSVVDIESKVFFLFLYSGFDISHLPRLVGSPFFHIGVLFFLESLLLTFLPALQLFPRISFLFSTVICCPISLLNVDYKLASRAIAGHLLKVKHSVVNKDQTCGVPGRFIGENVALLWDVVDFASSSNVPVTIISLDQEKAFDRVEGGGLFFF